MPAKHPLDDEDARRAVIDTVESHGQLADAAQSAGVNVRRLSRYLKTHDDFAAEVDAARRRGKVASHHADRMIPANPLASPQERARRLIAKCDKLVDDEAAPPALRSKALHVLAEYDIGPLVHAERLRAQREAAQLEQAGEKSTRPVVIRHGGKQPPAIIDV